MTQADFLVIGGGIAGAGVAYELAKHASVIVLEGEAQPGYHSTGRSAALFSEIYGNSVVRALSRASREFMLRPPEKFGVESLLKARRCLFVAHADQRAAFDTLRAMPDVATHTRELDSAAALKLVPILRPEWVEHCLLEEAAYDVDVHSLHHGFLRGMKERGGTLVCSKLVSSIDRTGGQWRVTAQDQTFFAPVIINAAGAWADEIAQMAGITPVGIEPRRRTALLVDAPVGMAIDDWPMVIEVGESFYFKPDAGRLLLSPADECPTNPTDAQPDDMDVAVAVDRIEQATTLSIRHVRHRWAGLRSFARDRTPVVGLDRESTGFFWLAGQGGYGIQTAPALSRLAAQLAREVTVAAEFEPLIPAIAPGRLRL